MEQGPEGLTGGTAPPDTVIYCDSSALVRAYLSDESEDGALSRLLLDERSLVVTSALAEVEVVAAISAAARAGRVGHLEPLLAEAIADLGPDGPILPLAVESERVLPGARALCTTHRLRALDAIHLAVALTTARDLAAGGELVLVTRDADQAAAARAEGLRVD